MQNSENFLEGIWRGFFVAKAPYGVFEDKVTITFSKDKFEIIYFDKENLRSSAKGGFAVIDEKLQLNSEAERFGDGEWSYVESIFTFSFLEKNPNKIKLNAKDHLGVEKTLSLEKTS